MHHCHPFHLLFSPFSTPSLTSLSLSDVRLLEKRLLGNDCSHFSSALSIHSPHPSPDGWLRTRHNSSFLAAVLPAPLRCPAGHCAVVWQESYVTSYVRNRALLLRPWEFLRTQNDLFRILGRFISAVKLKFDEYWLNFTIKYFVWQTGSVILAENHEAK